MIIDTSGGGGHAAVSPYPPDYGTVHGGSAPDYVQEIEIRAVHVLGRDEYEKDRIGN